jgi:hypothetical protein
MKINLNLNSKQVVNQTLIVILEIIVQNKPVIVIKGLALNLAVSVPGSTIQFVVAMVRLIVTSVRLGDLGLM